MWNKFDDMNWDEYIQYCIAEDNTMSLSDDDWSIVFSNEPSIEEMEIINNNAELLIADLGI